MSRTLSSQALSAALLACIAFGAPRGAEARPGDPPAPNAADADAALQKQETEARAKAAAELIDVARFCEKKSAYDDARKVYEKAVELCPQDPDLAADIGRLKNRKDLRAPATTAQIDDRRAKALAKCTEWLAPVAMAYAQANRADDLERIAVLLRAVGAPPENLDIAFFEPYLDLRPKKDVERLAGGSEFVDGAWLDPAKVAELDKTHADWTNPWIVSDESFEVRTTLPLRTARQALCHAAAFRRVFLRYFAGEWDLRPPAAKLRILMTATRAELDERVHAENPDAPSAPRGAVAWYVDGPAAGNACVACFESLDSRDRATKLDFQGVWWPLRHEIARQLAFEFSKHDAKPGRSVHASFWAIEGAAEFVPYLTVVKGSCVVTHPSWIPSCGKEIDSAFAWCRTNVEKIPPIDEFIGMPRPKFQKSADNVRIAATLAWYLLEGKNRAYRAGFVKFLQMVHQDRDESDAFTSCLAGADLKTLDDEFRTFCRTIQVDEK